MLTGIVIAQNEEESIQSSLKTLLFCDEVLVIDNNSSDRTKNLVYDMGVRVITDKTQGDFSYLRNFAAKEAKGEWLLYIDADEKVSHDLRANIKHELEQPRADAYYLRRRDHFMGKVLEHGEVAKVYERGIIRLMKKGRGVWRGSIHEEWKTDTSISSIDGFIEHYPHPTVQQFIEHVNRYSQIRAQELYNAGQHTNILQIIGYPVAKFVYTYFLKGGIKDGAAGFIYSFLMSFHSFLVRSTLCIKRASDENK